MMTFRIVAATTIAALSILPASAQSTTITIDTAHPGHAISPSLYGVFFEEINHAGDGGIYAEMVRNRTFKELDNGRPIAWSMQPADGASMELDSSTSLNEANPTSLKLTSTKSPAVAINEGYWGMSVRKGARYHLSFFARAAGTSAVDVRLETADGKVAAAGSVTGIGADWKRYSVDLKSNADVDHARLAIAQRSTGSIWLNVVSLFPTDTYKGHDLRPDLAEKVAALAPAFIRFPGGCYVEGDRTVENSFHWKETLGDIAGRPGHLNDIWGYRSTDGLGYHEYLQMCEDMHAAPLFVVNCGMAHHETIPMTEMESYVQGALDAIEYANGPVTSQWGAMRAKNGHPKPFGLKYVEIGNEDAWIAGYADHYNVVYKAIKAKYPDIITIADGPADAPIETLDDHYYNDPHWFWRHTDLYDATDRNGPKHYVGEYAVTKDCGQGNLKAALGEAAFMTGLERNSDVVTMASYAPLFTNVNNRAWNPDAIPFDSGHSFGTPSYWVQGLFGNNRPDRLLTVAVDNAPVQPASVGTGSIGLGTWHTSSEYKDIQVVQDSKTVYQSDFAKGIDSWSKRRGDWSVIDGAYRQSSDEENPVTVLNAPSWSGGSDYTLTLKARKISGAEGFLVMFRSQDDQNWYWLNVGGWGNSQTALERRADGDQERLGASTPTTVETNRWYDIRIDLHGPHIQCYVDNKPVVDVVEQSTPLFATTAGIDKDGTIIVKAVNGSSESLAANVTLAGTTVSGYKGTATTLTSASPDDENSLDNPDKVAPSTKPVSVDAPSFAYSFPANSVTVLRLKN